MKWNPRDKKQVQELINKYIELKESNVDHFNDCMVEWANELYDDNVKYAGMRSRIQSNVPADIRMKYSNKVTNTKKDKKNSEKVEINNDTAEIVIREGRVGEGYEKLEKAMRSIGEEPKDYIITPVRYSNWDAQTKEGPTDFESVRFKIEKRKDLINTDEYIEKLKEKIVKNIKPLKYIPKKKNTELDNDVAIYCDAEEIHYNKIGEIIETGEMYNCEVAEARHWEIRDGVLELQDMTNAGVLFYNHGNDEFNINSSNYATAKGTPQRTEKSFTSMVVEWTDIQIRTIKGYADRFNKVVIRLQKGNHAPDAELQLHITLLHLFSNYPNVEVVADYKPYQAQLFGNNVFFTSHGQYNEKRTIESWATDFPIEHAAASYREWRKGHVHHRGKKLVAQSPITELAGIVVKTISSPAGRDVYHYEERYVGANAGYSIDVFHKEKHLMYTKHITFDPIKKKQLTKTNLIK